MTESEFNDLVDKTLEQIEARLDDAETDIDAQLGGGVLTIICENKTQLIFTRQTPVKQLWLATKTGGFHFDYDASQASWVLDSDGQPLGPFLTRAYQEQAGEQLTFDLSGA
ncbi:MAG: iron donor protein CyaY [Neptuniibacter caesariensis]|uniref:Iron-sulfur cluster assembly protein CyaY n=1 Tax=Neptuniibacter caesariensis TaxID=207954 RepID=A0A2G6JB13_NEPCE|nr:MAG: iron donor protein CyaY [Neptuniibacter caesariensis]